MSSATWVSAIGAIVVAACGASRNAGLPRDDGGLPPPDAALGDASNGRDASDGRDAADVDAAPDAFAGGDATVIVFGDFGAALGQPEPGIPVMFHTGDGRLIASLVTDATGKATATIPRDASVTIVRQFGPDDTELLTRTNVQPGAVLKLGFQGPVPTSLATMTVTWTKPPNSFVGHFDVVTPCGSAFANFNDRSATFPISDACANTTFPVYVIARDNGDFLNQSGVEGQTAINGATIPLTTWLGPTLVTSGVTNVPTNVFVGGQIEQAAHGLAFDGDISGFSFTGDGSFTYHVAPSPGSELREQIDISCFGGCSFDQIIARRKPFGSSFSLDVGAAMLPAFTSAGFNLASRTWTWSTSAPIAPDVQLLYLSYQRANFQRFSWSVIASGEIGSSFVLPEVPTSLAQIAPRATDRLSGAVSEVKLGNGLTFAQVQDNLAQWLATGFPDNSVAVSWTTAPAELDSLTKSSALF